MADKSSKISDPNQIGYDSKHDLKLFKMIRMQKNKREIQAVIPISDEMLRVKHGEVQQIDERFYKCDGLYPTFGKIIFEEQGIGIPISRLGDSGFQEGDEFDVVVNNEDNTIVLKKIEIRT